MTEPAADVRAAAPPALERYVRSMRKKRGGYYAILAVLLAITGVLVGLAWTHGEVAHTTLHTVRTAPADLPPAPPADTQRLAWRTGDRSAIGTPQWNGTIVTFDTHTVRGRDARTGKPTWSYTRDNRVVCTAIQTQGITIAVYQLNGNCDEVTALASDTGARSWTRTLDENGLTIDGRPNIQVTSFAVLIWNSHSIYAINPDGGEDRWTYNRRGCTIHGVVLGSTGALVSQSCTDLLHCSTLIKFCAHGPQLFLRDPQAGNDPTDATLNPNHSNTDAILWLARGNTDLPVAADAMVAALNRTTHQLDTFDATAGKQVRSFALDPAPATLTITAPVAFATADLSRIDGVTYAITATAQQWATRTSQLPTVLDAASAPGVDSAQLVVTAPAGVQLLDGADGTPARTIALPAPPAGSTVYQAGAGFLVAAPRQTLVYAP